MSEPVILAVIGGLVTLLTALIGKVVVDGHHTRRETRAVHESINNRPTTLSERLDEVLAEVQHNTAVTRGMRADIIDHDKRLMRLERGD